MNVFLLLNLIAGTLRKVQPPTLGIYTQQQDVRESKEKFQLLVIVNVCYYYYCKFNFLFKYTLYFFL